MYLPYLNGMMEERQIKISTLFNTFKTWLINILNTLELTRYLMNGNFDQKHHFEFATSFRKALCTIWNCVNKSSAFCQNDIEECCRVRVLCLQYIWYNNDQCPLTLVLIPLSMFSLIIVIHTTYWTERVNVSWLMVMLVSKFESYILIECLCL